MIPRSGDRFLDKIMLKLENSKDDDACSGIVTL
jgi:hypothetical protein